MNYAHVLLTEETNVKDRRVVNNDLIEKKIISSDDIVEIYDMIKEKNDKIKMINISLYDNLLILDSKRYYILNSLWKPEKDETYEL